MLALVLALAVQSDKVRRQNSAPLTSQNQSHITTIQSLEQWAQGELMASIESVRRRLLCAQTDVSDHVATTSQGRLVQLVASDRSLSVVRCRSARDR